MTNEMGRRGFLIGGVAAAIGTGLFLAEPGASASAATQSSALPQPVSAAASKGFTDLAGVRAEYSAAVKSWPLALPAGYSLPKASQLQDPADGPAQWERGSGLAEAYGYWFTLTAVAAVAAARRGDLSASQVHLDTLVRAQSSTIARSVIDDPDGLVIREVIAPARNQQDFSRLSSAFGLDRLDPASPVARIARTAGDL